MKLPEHIQCRVTWNKPNKTYTAELPSIKNIEPLVKECDLGCGQIIDQQQGITIAKRLTPVHYWQRMCKVCKQYQNPRTGAYDCSLNELNAILKHNERNLDK